MSNAKEILFYHVKNGSVHQVASVLLGKILERKQMAVVDCANHNDMQELSEFLWNVKNSFLPHTTSDDEDNLIHPIFLKCNDVIPLGRDMLLACGTTPKSEFINYEKTIFIFHNDDIEQVQSARNFWKEHNSVHSLTYWIQNDEGKWQKAG